MPRARIPTLLASLALLAFAALSPRLIPYCMDEFAHYHALGCAAHPLTQKWSSYTDGSPFREACGDYDLALPFTHTLLPLRSYHYIGSLPAAVFYPFWAVVRDPLSARLQGAVLLLLATALVARLTGARALDLLAATALWPVYLLAFVVDLGPVGLSLVLLALAMLAVERAASATGAAALVWAAAAGLIFFLGFWTKLVFAWTAPALAVFAWTEARRRGIGARRVASAALVAGVCALLPSALLLTSKDADGEPYYSIVNQGHISMSEGLNDFGLHPFLRMSRYLYDGSYVLPRTLKLAPSFADGLPLLATAVVLVLAGVSASRRYLALALLTFAVTLVTRSAWGPHHIAFTLFFLVASLGIAMADARTRWPRARLALHAVPAFYLALLLLRLPGAEVNADTSFGKDALLSVVRHEDLDRRDIQAHTSWGTFYIAHLFGSRDQIVVWAPGLPAKPEMIAEVSRIAVAEKRGIALVTMRERDSIVTPAVREAWGEPASTRLFGEWTLLEFARR